MLFVKSLIFILILLATSSAWTLDADFWKHKKEKAHTKKLREKASSGLRNKREERQKKKNQQALSYSKVRKKQVKKRQKVERLFEQDLKKKEKAKIRLQRQALLSAQKKRKSRSSSWKEQNIEYGIKKPILSKKGD